MPRNAADTDIPNWPIDAYPLQWALGHPRTPAYHRKHARFASNGRQVTIAGAINRLMAELRALRATNVVVSSNLPVRRDGLPYASAGEPADPGVTVYFRLPDGAALAYPCDRWKRLADNITAIAWSIRAQRAQDRYGVGKQNQAFAGYKALTAASAKQAWYEVLTFKEPPRSLAEVITRSRDLARKHHPDAGGSTERMAEINAAVDEARAYYDEGPGAAV